MVPLHRRSTTTTGMHFVNHEAPLLDRIFQFLMVIGKQYARSSMLVIAGLCLSVALVAQTPANIRSWLPANGGLWTDGNNWSDGIVPRTGDDVFISTAQSAPITAVPILSLNSLNITASCQLEGPANAATLTLNGALSINAGAVLSLNNKLTLVLGANSNSSIQGTLTIAKELALNSGTVLAVGPTGIINGGAPFTLNAGATLKIGSVSGIVTGNTLLGNIQVTGMRTYNAGAHYVYNGLSNQNTGDGYPTALTGSLTIDNPNGVSIVAATRTITTGTLNLVNGTFTINNGGNRLSMGSSISASTATIKKSGGDLSGALLGSNWYTVEYLGNSQTAGLELGGPGFRNMTISLTAGQALRLGASRTVPGTLTLSSGIVLTEADTLIVSGNTPTAISGGSSSAYIVGNLRRALGTSAAQANYTFPLGTSAGYAALNLTFTNITTAGNLTATVMNSDHPSIASAANINAAKSVNTYWRLSGDGIVKTGNYEAIFNWSEAAQDREFDFTNAIVGFYNGSLWSYPNLGTKSTYSLQMVGQSAFGEFQVGKYCAATTITQQPLATNVCPGDTAKLSVTASGANLSYQWRYEGNPIPGATSASFQTTTSGNYAVVVSGDCGIVTSNSVRVNIKAPTVIVNQPEGGAICRNDSLVMTVTATGEGTLTYQWKNNGSLIDGAVFASYTASDTGHYTVDVIANCGTLTSMEAVVSYLAPTTIITQPTGSTICDGSNWTIRVNATGEGNLSYQWFKDGQPILDANSFAYTATKAGYYKVLVTGACGTLFSDSVSLIINALTTITAQPADQEITYGDNANFAVQASGSGTLSYQWQVNAGDGWSNLTEGSGYVNTVQPALDLITPAVSFDGYNYKCVVSGLCGDAISQVVNLKVKKAMIAVSAHDAQRIYGDENPQFSASLTGFRNNETMANSGITGMPSFSTTATKDSAAGEYPIIPALGTLKAANYAFQFVNGKLTIGKAPLLITAVDTTREYGDENPEFTASFNGFKNGEVLGTSDLKGKVGLFTSANANSPVGEYLIQTGVGTLISTNYHFTFANGKLVVGPALLTVRAEDKEKIYGDENPPLTSAITGFKNGQTSADAGISGAPALSTKAELMSDAGDYDIDITPGDLSARNYVFKAALGKLKIHKATVTVIAEDKYREYGLDNPEFSISVEGFRHGQGFQTGAASGSPVLSTLADIKSDTGTYDIMINPGSLFAKNYAFNLLKGKLIISQAMLMVTADDKEREYGQENPNFSASFTGFRNGQDTSNAGITGTPVYTTIATALSEVGDYDIMIAPGSLVSRNYAFKVGHGKLRIGKAQLTITAQDQHREYGDPNPELTVSYAGFRNGQTLGNSAIEGSVAVTTPADEFAEVGEYPINLDSGSLKSRNYSFKLVKGKLNITQATVNIQADDKERIYGDSNPEFTATFSGFKNGQNRSNSGIGGNPVMSTIADALTQVGDYDIMIAPGSLVSKNYAFNLKKGKLKIGQATLNITAENKQKHYGEANPALTYIVTGFKNGDTLVSPVIEGAPSLTTTATQKSPVGKYDIVVSEGTIKAKNYKFTFTDASLTIDKAMVTIRADFKQKVYGDENPTLTATYSGFAAEESFAVSDLKGDISLTTTATTSSGFGDYPIVVSQGSLLSSNYDFRFEEGVLRINKAVVTFTAEDKTKQYGDELPPLTLTYNGFKNGESIQSITAVSGAPELSTKATKNSPVGRYDIEVAPGTLTAANYEFRYVFGTLAVTKAQLDVSADNQSRLYGEANPELSATISGFRNGETLANSGVQGAPALSTTATIGSPVGNYEVATSLGSLTAKNYDFKFSNGNLAIGKAPLSITAEDKSREYGESNPPLTLAYSGFRNGDAPGAALVSGTPVVSTTANTVSGAGVYDILVDTGSFKASNYDITWVTGKLTVTKATLLVTAEDKRKAYGEANPIFTARYEGFKNNESFSSSKILGEPSFTSNADVSSPVGTYPINIAEGSLSSGNYNFNFIRGNLVIGKLMVTVTANDQQKIYGDENPQLTYTITGIKTGETLATSDIKGLPSLQTTVGKTTPAGNYTIEIGTGSLTSNNYDFNFIPGKLVIQKAVLTIAAEDKSRIYGDPNPTLSVSFSGFKNGDTWSSSVQGQLALSTTAVSGSPVGVYPITPALGTLLADNYTFEFMPAKLTIQKAELRVKAEFKNKTYGAPVPELTIVYNGFKNGDVLEFSDLKGAPALSTTASSSSPIGVYDIDISEGDLSSNNYSFKFEGAQLTVNRAVLTIKADNKSRVFGVQNPELTVTYSGFVNGETLATSGVKGDPAIFTLATPESPAGSYEINVAPGTLTATNYEFNLVAGKLAIGRALITITAHDQVKTYGDRNPTLTYSLSGFVNDETLATSDIEGLPLITSNVTESTSAGVYEINLALGTLTSENYVFELVKGKFVVQKATLTITAHDKSRVYGEPNPQFTASYSGFVLNETLATSGIDGMPSLATPATSNSPAGEYLIKGAEGSLISNNYKFVFIDAKLTISKAALKIIAEQKTRKYGQANPELTLTFNGFANSETFATSGITGFPNLTTLAAPNSPVGTYDININEGNLASDKYYFVLEKGKLIVTKALLKISVDNKNRIYGEPNPQLTYTYEGFVNGEALASSGVTGEPTLYTAATQSSTAGTYAITINEGTLAASNYMFSLIPGNLVIGKATITITADNQSRIYGEMNPLLSVKYAGFTNGESLSTSAITGLPQVTTEATTSSPVGVYAINVDLGNLASDNYAFNFVKGSLKIEKATLDVIADNKVKTYGAAVPELTATFVGFVNGETLAKSDITGLPRMTTEATTASGVGTYSIIAEAGSLFSANYAFNFKNGTLTIGTATITVTAQSKTKVYGEAMPELTYTYAGFVNGESLASSGISGLPQLSTPATISSSPGVYQISIDKGNLASDKYAFQLVNSTLTITKAILRVSAEDKRKVYGSANPLLTVIYEGFVNGETLATSDVRGAASVSTDAQVNSPVGDYPITIAYGTLSSVNYNIVYSNAVLSVTKAELTVTAANASRRYGSANPTFTYAINGFVNNENLGSSGVSGTPALTTTATVLSPVDTYDIEANLGTLGAGNYSFKFVKGTLTINKVNLTVTAQNATRAYGAPDPAFAVTFNGFVNGETLATSGIQGDASFTTNATVTSMVGNYTLTPAIGTLTARNYSFNSFSNGTLTITKANLNIIAEDKSRIYGTANPDLTYTMTGFVNNETMATAALTGIPVLSTGATSTSNVGVYPIVISMGTLASINYNLNLVNGSLAINKATVTVTAQHSSRIYGAPDPVFSAAYTGFANGQTLSTSGINGAPAYTTTATVSSPVGTYDINPSVGSLSSGNYDFVFAKGALTVTKATLMVTANDQFKTYGAELPIFTASFNGFMNGETLATSGVNGTAEMTTGATASSPMGTYIINISAGSLAAQNYTFAFTGGKLVIGKAVITVTAESKKKIYGESNPGLTYTLNGFVNGETLASSGITGTPVLSTVAITTSPAGDYDIVPTLGSMASSKYDFNFVKGTLTVGKAMLTVIPETKMREYGGTDPVFTATYQGFVNGDILSSAGITGKAEMTTVATQTSPVGSYDINASLGTLFSNNYDFMFAKGTLVVGKASITVTGDNKNRPYGSANPDLTYTFNGFVNGETLANSGIIGKPSISTLATPTSPLGTYEITTTEGTLAASNYKFVYVNGALTIGKALITITAEDKSKPYASATPALTYTYSGFVNGETLANSGISGVPVITSEVTNLTSGGVYEITLEMGTLAATNYQFNLVNGKFTVTKIMLTVTADNKNRNYGAANPKFTASYTGFVNGETLVSSGINGSPSYTTAATATSPVGNYDINIGQGTLISANYSFSFAKGSLTVNKATLTVTADNKSKLYGAANPVMTSTISGFVNGETLASSGITGTAALATTATASSPVGRYDIDVTQGSLASGNYTFTYVKGVLSVTKATLIISADNKTKIYSTANPAFTVSYSGFVNNETLASSGISGEPVITTSATDLSPAGQYDITASIGTLSSDNYLFIFNKGILTVAKAVLTVTAENKNRIYGAPNPEFTASITGLVSGETLESIGLTGTPKFTTLANYSSAVGAYEINVEQGTLTAPNYAFNFEKGILIIDKATLTVTADNKTRSYGAANPTFSVTYTGFVNNETFAYSGISGSPSLLTTASTSSIVGNYPIYASLGTLASNNYNFNFVNGTLTVGKATITVTADNKNRLYGAANPVFTASYSGFVNGQTMLSSGITGAPAIATGAVATSPVGTYEISPSLGSLQSTNYSFNFIKGALFVGKATVMVTADDQFRKYGSDNPELTASYSGFVNGETLATSGISGQPVLSTPAVQTTPAGVYTIAANAGTLAAANYAFSFAPGKLTIGKALINVIADNKTKKYGSMNPTLTVSYTGFVNGETLASSGITGTPGIITTALLNSPLGTYPITANLGSMAADNYDFNFVNGILTIGKATLTVKADDKTRIYGDADPAFTAVINGFVNGETLATSDVKGLAAFTTNAVATSPVGNYTITPALGTLTSNNYEFQYETGKLAVTKAMLLVTADPKTKVYGSLNPEFTATFTGYKNGENFASSGIRGTATMTSPATISSAVGSYDILASLGSLTATNYDFSFANGVLTVGKATITVTADNKSKIYGSANPGLTYTLNGYVNGQTLATSGITGAPVLNTTVTVLSGVGNYDISIAAGTLAAANYDFKLVKGVLSVDKATLNVTADNKFRIYGDANPTLTATFSGFVNGESLSTSGVTGTQAIYTMADPTTPAGTHPIIPALGTLAAANYSFNFVSGTLTIGKASLTVVADNKNRKFGEPNPLFTVTFNGFKNGETQGTSDLTGSAALTTEASQISPVGSYDIMIAGGTLASTNYSFTYVKGVLVIGKATLTVTADSKVKTYGQPNPGLTYTITGNPGEAVQTSSITGTPALSTAANLYSNVGNFDITITAGTLASLNYDFVYAKGTLAIGKATLDVRAEDKSRKYGVQNPELNATITGFVLGQDFSSAGITGTPSITTKATAVSPVGTYAITSSGGSLEAKNYAFNFINGTLTVEKAVLTVIAEAKSRSYGMPNPVFTPSFNGFANGETLATSGVLGTPDFTTSATALSPVGTYDIVPVLGTLSAVNYSFEFRNGLLTVGKAKLTVMADNKTKVYGAQNPLLTVTYNGFVNNETFAGSDIKGLPAITTTADALSVVGTYAIESQLGTLYSNNYEFGFTSGTLTVTKAVVTVTVDNKTKSYGAMNPVFTSTYAGFVNGENLSTSKITGAPEYSTRATETSWMGTYPVFITKGTLDAANYDFTLVAGTLTVISPTCTTSGTLVVADKCYGSEISLTYNNAAAPGPYTLIINDSAYTNIYSGVPFNTGTVARNRLESVWEADVVGEDPAVANNRAIEVGVRIRPNVEGTINGIRFYKRAANTGTHVGSLWSTDGTLLARATFTNETASGWQEVVFSNPVEVIPGATYIASYYAPNGNYAYTANAFRDNRVTNTSGSLTAIRASDGGNGMFRNGSGFPNQYTSDNGNFYVDVLFSNLNNTNRFALTGVISATGCAALGEPIQAVEINVVPSIGIAMLKKDPVCLDGGSGAITLNAYGCNSPFYFSIDSGATFQSNGVFEGLNVGTYKVRVKDAGNFSRDTTITLSVETAVWTGLISSDWHNAANWNTQTVPGPNTHVIIPPTGKECLITAADVTVASVQVREGAIFRTQNGRKLTLTGKCVSLPVE